MTILYSTKSLATDFVSVSCSSSIHALAIDACLGQLKKKKVSRQPPPWLKSLENDNFQRRIFNFFEKSFTPHIIQFSRIKFSQPLKIQIVGQLSTYIVHKMLKL